MEETDNRDPKGDNVPPGDNKGATHGKCILRSLIWSGLMYPPFWFSMLKSKKAMLILLEGNFNIIISEGLIVSSKLSHTIFTLDSMTCHMEGLINRLVKNGFSDLTKVQEGRDRPRKDVMNRRQGKALSEGCHERKEAWMVVSSREKINNNKN